MHNMPHKGTPFLISVLLTVQSVQSVTAADLSDPPNPARAAMMSRALHAFNGTAARAKRGTMVKLGLDLTNLYFEHQDFLVAGGQRGLGAEFRSANKLLRSHQDAVLIDAVATDNVFEMRTALVALGMTQPAVFGQGSGSSVSFPCSSVASSC